MLPVYMHLNVTLLRMFKACTSSCYSFISRKGTNPLPR